MTNGERPTDASMRAKAVRLAELEAAAQELRDDLAASDHIYTHSGDRQMSTVTMSSIRNHPITGLLSAAATDTPPAHKDISKLGLLGPHAERDRQAIVAAVKEIAELRAEGSNRDARMKAREVAAEIVPGQIDAGFDGIAGSPDLPTDPAELADLVGRDRHYSTRASGRTN